MFSARTDAFCAEVLRWRQEGWVASAGEAGLWVGVPSMSTLTRRLAAPLALTASTSIAAAERRSDGWILRASDQAGALADLRYDAVVIAVPAEQAMPLLAASPALQARLACVRSEPCWAVMAAWDVPLGLPVAHLAPNIGPLAAAWRADTKPQRPVVAGIAERWVLQGREDWTRRHLDIDPAMVAKELLSAFGLAAKVALPAPIHRVAHRWRFAQIAQPATDPFGWDPQAGIGGCGGAWRCTDAAEVVDGFERAWLSGTRLAEAMCGSNAPDR
jgi:predicted NAD/FAD-dependent oxidoreductase